MEDVYFNKDQEPVLVRLKGSDYYVTAKGTMYKVTALGTKPTRDGYVVTRKGTRKYYSRDSLVLLFKKFLHKYLNL